MRELSIDIETYSGNDLKKGGVYKYIESPDFKVLLFAYSIDNGEVQCVDLECGEEIPQEVLHALTDEKVKKRAFNANFERICLTKHLKLNTPLAPRQWHCTMVKAGAMGFPMSLAQCGEVLKIKHEKLKEGEALIRKFSVPNRKGTRTKAEDDPEAWELFKAYCIRDVEAELQILKRINRIETTATERELYITDQEINDRGVLVDTELVTAAEYIFEAYKYQLLEEAKAITGLDNPNSVEQLKKYILDTTGVRLSSVNKAVLENSENAFLFHPNVQRVLQIRKEAGKTSNKKYTAILNCICSDNRIRGMLQFYGASRTGRWAGRFVQLQNLPQNHIKDISRARELVKNRDTEALATEFGNPTQVLSELIRTSFIAPSNASLIVCDFSAIEARVIAWLAGERWIIEAFNQGKDLYCEAAARMFGVIVEKEGQNSELRQKGKIATLALGYQGGVGALDAMGGAKLGLSDYEKARIVELWRATNKNIVSLWATLEKAAKSAIKTTRKVTIHKGITLEYKWGVLIITLPSGRSLCYPRAKVIAEYDRHWGREREQIVYQGTNQTTKKWEEQKTYGGKITENVVQAIARDIMGVTLLRAKERGYKTVFHVHDEAVFETKQGQSLEEVEAFFSEPIEWCKGLPLKGEGFITPYYMKG